MTTCPLAFSISCNRLVPSSIEKITPVVELSGLILAFIVHVVPVANPVALALEKYWLELASKSAHCVGAVTVLVVRSLIPGDRRDATVEAKTMS
mgnify:CR=1 FL=1